jgi:glycosyltransferase involved in cell wall biosynthesis
MARIVIDARESGTSTGRYIDKLVEYLYKLKPEHDFLILAKPSRLKFFKELTPDFEIVECPHKEFSFDEQLGYFMQLNKLKADLVHFAMIQQPILYRRPVVTTIADLTTTRFRNPAKNPFVFTAKQQVYKAVIKRVAKKSRKILTISQFVKDDVASYTSVNPDKISVTYPAVDKITDKPIPVKGLGDNLFLLYVGRSLPHKNLRRLVDAYQEVKWTHPQLSLVFAGKLDDNYRLLEAYAASKKIGGVIFTDFVSEGELSWLYQNAEAYVFPSLSEGFGLPGLEAMQYGLPVISSSATCLPEIYKDAALYFDPKNVKDMAEKIKQLLDDKALAKALIEKGRKVVASYSWQDMAEQTLDVFNQALKQTSRR